MECIEEIYFNTWEEFVEYFQGFNVNKRDFMFRGQSNAVDRSNHFIRWQLISSFNRNSLRSSNYSFQQYLLQQFNSDLFRLDYANYNYKKVAWLINSSILEKCYFFQHYGIETCFIDFTYDPLIALYFSLTSVPGRSGGQYDLNGNPLFYSNDTNRDFVSVYQIDIPQLKHIIGIKEIRTEKFDKGNLDDYEIKPTKYSSMSAYIGLDLNPISEINQNFNLTSQKGCFLYFDNENFQDSFERFLNLFFLESKAKPTSSILKIYNINYNSLFKKMRSRNPSYKPVFRFLREHKLTGEFLFDDIQGLKYDLNFFHNQ